MTMVVGTPPAEHEIDESLVRRLLSDQHPALADESIELLGVGWDNANYRVGKSNVVRLPRRQAAAGLIENELTWLPVLAEMLPLPVPVPNRIGRPNGYYPWPWSVAPWLPGRTADLEPPLPTEAAQLAQFLLALHQPAPPAAPRNPFRGVPLHHRAQHLEERLARIRQQEGIVTPDLIQIWERAVDAPGATEQCWLHGDLHAGNVLVARGRISGIIDWGDLTAGDVATDLAGVWSLLDEPRTRAECLATYGATTAQLARAKGWAMSFGVALLDSGLVDHPHHAAMGRAILSRLREDV